MEERNKVSYKFSKESRLHHRSLVEGLFRLGKSFYEFPFRVTWRVLDKEALQKNFRCKIPEGIGSVQMMVTVPKKKRRRAVDRVLMRRRIKEAYRNNRHELCDKASVDDRLGTLSMAFVYIHDQNLPYSHVEEKMKLVLSKVIRKINPSSDRDV